MYPLEVYYPDDPNRLCRPKAGQSLVIKIFAEILRGMKRIKECDNLRHSEKRQTFQFYFPILGLFTLRLNRAHLASGLCQESATFCKMFHRNSHHQQYHDSQRHHHLCLDNTSTSASTKNFYWQSDSAHKGSFLDWSFPIVF